MSNDNFPIEKPVLVVVGPTAVGKTALSLVIAEKNKCEIVSLDSMQIYRYMDIGTAKASHEEREQIPHHLIDIANPDEHYDAQKYVDDAIKIINDIHNRGRIPLVTGGTGLYLRSLLEGLFENIGEYPIIRKELQHQLEEEGASKLHDELMAIDCLSAQRIHINDTHRLIRALEIYRGTGKNWSDHLKHQASSVGEKRFSHILLLGLTTNRKTLYNRINTRTSQMMQNGLKEEVVGLLNMGYRNNLKSMQSIGYRHMLSHLLENWTLEKTEEMLSRDTRRYAKRQYTWFNKMDLEWFDVSNEDKILYKIDQFMKQSQV